MSFKSSLSCRGSPQHCGAISYTPRVKQLTAREVFEYLRQKHKSQNKNKWHKKDKLFYTLKVTHISILNRPEIGRSTTTKSFIKEEYLSNLFTGNVIKVFLAGLF